MLKKPTILFFTLLCSCASNDSETNQSLLDICPASTTTYWLSLREKALNDYIIVNQSYGDGLESSLNGFMGAQITILTGEYLLCLEGYYAFQSAQQQLWNYANFLAGQPGAVCFPETGDAFDCANCQYKDCNGGGNSNGCSAADGSSSPEQICIQTVGGELEVGTAFVCPLQGGGCP